MASSTARRGSGRAAGRSASGSSVRCTPTPTRASSLRIEETPLAELRKILLPDKSGRNRPEDLRLPLLKEYIGACREGGKKCVLELKNPFREADIDRLLEEISETGWAENMIYISFSRENCLALRNRLPEAPIQFLTSKEIDRELIDFLKAHRFGLDIAHRRLTPAAIETLRAEGVPLNCWTVDDPARAASLAASGVDFITTNILE